MLFHYNKQVQRAILFPWSGSTSLTYFPVLVGAEFGWVSWRTNFFFIQFKKRSAYWPIFTRRGNALRLLCALWIRSTSVAVAEAVLSDVISLLTMKRIHLSLILQNGVGIIMSRWWARLLWRRGSWWAFKGGKLSANQAVLKGFVLPCTWLSEQKKIAYCEKQQKEFDALTLLR